MFAHEIANKLRKSIKILKGLSHQKDPLKDYTLGLYESILDALRCSVQFNMGDIDDTEHLFEKDYGRPIFYDPTYLKMPYPICFFECSFDNYFNADLPDISKEIGRDEEGMIDNSREAVLCVEFPLKDKTQPALWLIHCFTFMQNENRWIICPISFFAQAGGLTDEVKSFIRSMFSQRSDNLENLFSTENGEKIHTFPIFHHPIEDKNSLEICLQVEMAINLKLLFHSIQLLNCKNIVTEDVEPDKKEQKRRKMAGQQPLFTYKILKIAPGRGRTKGGGEDKEPTGAHHRVHLCRGHFKEYSEERPLLGKISGRWWWQPRLRGRNRDGIIIKGYEVENNKNEPREVAL